MWGATAIRLSNLVPHATVTVTVDEAFTGQAGVTDAQETFTLPPLTEGQEVTVSQTLCGETSGESSVSVGIRRDPPMPAITQPFECGTVVHVENLVPGARVRLLSLRYFGVIADFIAQGEQAHIPVPSLRPFDDLQVEESACGTTITTGTFVQQFTGSLPVPTVVRPVLDSDRSVAVSDVHPGAVVDVFVGGTLRGVASGGEDVVDVPIVGRLNEDTEVSARQRLCRAASDVGGAAEVQACEKRLTVGLKYLAPDFAGPLRVQADWVRRLFRHHGIDVEIVDEELLDLPALLTIDETDRDAIRELLRHRNHLREQDVAAYMIDDVVNGGGGGLHLSGTDGAIISSKTAFQEIWTTAHEIGHVLELEHVSDEGTDRLMHPGPRFPGDATPRIDTALAPDEVNEMKTSDFMRPCR
ncbi:hypothetical protein ACFQH6_18755 [Halobacteriaceae archaeon GCM10025711]